MSDVRKLAKIVADHSRQIKGLSGGPQAAYSSIEGGSMDSYDSDGKLRLRIGAQDDGTQGVKYVQGPPPPRPTAPVVSVDGPVVRVRWDGMLLGGHIPEDFARIDVHFALASEDLEADEAVRGNLATSAGNETVLAATQTGTYRVGLVAMSQSRARSEMSDVTEVEVELVNLKGAIDTAVDNASGGSNHYRPAPPEGTDHTENDLWFDTSVDPETGLTAYTPHRWDEAAQDWMSVGDQRTAAIQDAQDDLAAEVATVRTSVDGKNAITQSIDAPPSQYDGAVGDRWERMSSMGSGGSLISNWRWNGDVWVSTIISDAVLGNVDAAKIGTGYLNADRIDSHSITADKLLIGDAGSLIPWSTATTDPHTSTGGLALTSVMDPDIGETLSVTGGTATGWEEAIRFYYNSETFVIPTSPDTEYRFSALLGRVGGAVRAQMFIAWYDASGNYTSGSYGPNITDIPKGGVKEFSYYATSRADSYGVRVALRVESPMPSAWLRIKEARLEPTTGATLIQDGAITTEKIATGAITAESGIVGSLDAGVITVGEMNGARIEAGTIDTPQLAFGAATGDVLSVDALNFKTAVGLDIRGSSFRAGDAVEMTEDFGIRQFGPDGALNVSLPSDGSPAEFRGDLSARTLTATGRMSIQGPGAIASGGVLELESGVVPPISSPSVNMTWDTDTFPPLEEDDLAQFGLARSGDLWWRWVEHTDATRDHRGRLEGINDSMEVVVSVGTGNRLGRNGLTALNDQVFMFGPKTGDNTTRHVFTYTNAGVFVREWQQTGYGARSEYEPAIGTDGTNIVTVQSRRTNGEVIWRTFHPTTGALRSTVTSDSNVYYDMSGIYIGQGDFGTQRAVVAVKRDGTLRHQFLAYTTSTVPQLQSEQAWYSANQEAPVGFTWWDGKFYSLTQGGRLSAYESLEADRFAGDDEDDWWLATTWWSEGEPNAQETPAGPAQRFRYLHRARIRHSVSDVPEGVERIRFYVAKMEGTPQRTDLRWMSHVEATVTTSWTGTIGDDWQTGANPPASNSFTTDAPGEIHSALGNFRVDGAGSGSWGSFDFHGDGTVTGRGTVVTGIVNHPGINNGGDEHHVTVTFPAGRFTEPPVIVLTNSNGHLTPTVNRDSLTATSFQVRTWNFSTGNARESITTWIAVEV